MGEIVVQDLEMPEVRMEVDQQEVHMLGEEFILLEVTIEVVKEAIKITINCHIKVKVVVDIIAKQAALPVIVEALIKKDVFHQFEEVVKQSSITSCIRVDSIANYITRNIKYQLKAAEGVATIVGTKEAEIIMPAITVPCYEVQEEQLAIIIAIIELLVVDLDSIRLASAQAVDSGSLEEERVIIVKVVVVAIEDDKVVIAIVIIIIEIIIAMVVVAVAPVRLVATSYLDCSVIHSHLQVAFDSSDAVALPCYVVMVIIIIVVAEDIDVCRRLVVSQQDLDAIIIIAKVVSAIITKVEELNTQIAVAVVVQVHLDAYAQDCAKGLLVGLLSLALVNIMDVNKVLLLGWYQDYYQG